MFTSPYATSIFLFVALTVFFSCVSSEKMYEKGEYERAFRFSLARLENTRKDKEVEENKEYLHKSLAKIIDLKQDYVQPTQSKEALPELENRLDEVKNLRGRICTARPFMDERFDSVFDTLEHRKKETEADISQYHYDYAQKLYTEAEYRDDKFRYKAAYRSFEDSKIFGLRLPQVDSFQRACHHKGIIIYGVQASERYAERLNNYVPRYKKGEPVFLEVVYAERNSRDFDCFITYSYGRPSVSSSTSSDTETFSKDVVISTYTDSTGIHNTYEEVYYKVETEETVVSGDINAFVHVEANTDNCRINGNSFSKSLDYTTVKTSGSGDFRAKPTCFISKYELAKSTSEVENELRNLIDAVPLNYISNCIYYQDRKGDFRD